MTGRGLLIAALLLGACSPDLATLRPDFQGSRFLHPYPQPAPGRTIQWSSLDGSTTYAHPPPSLFEPSNPFTDPPGSNFIRSVNSNLFDGRGREMPNTLPSTPDTPYNLHDGPVQTTAIDRRSPTSDIDDVLRTTMASAARGTLDMARVQEAIDILEGNPVFPERTYNGFPLLHYVFGTQVRSVDPIHDAAGNLVGGNVDIHQLWYDSHIESDTAFIDASEMFDVPWTITYTVDVLAQGSDDFAPFMFMVDDPYLSPPGAPPRPHAALDQSFVPMLEGTRNVIKIKMTKAKYWNLTYHWGWRVHPPRIQVTENAVKSINGRKLVDFERRVFGDNPRASREEQLAAISKIGDLAPAKRMWNAFRAAMASGSAAAALPHLQVADEAFFDWQDRTKLPAGVTSDPDADVTLLYANNTIYGEMKGGGIARLSQWDERPQNVVVSLINADHFVHGYVNVDFGGLRGWENQYRSTVAGGGSGAWFTFGRAHWWVNAGGPWGLIDVPPFEDGEPGRHRVELAFDFEPSRRLRMYQFDPYHHNVAIFSVH
ncbi:MAG: hypothetical protein HOF34_02755 [Rhodospirillaceae bacterium]|nr:hypothetical protein [Rhodospirillaceae bacterium]